MPFVNEERSKGVKNKIFPIISLNNTNVWITQVSKRIHRNSILAMKTENRVEISGTSSGSKRIELGRIRTKRIACLDREHAGRHATYSLLFTRTNVILSSKRIPWTRLVFNLFSIRISFARILRETLAEMLEKSNFFPSIRLRSWIASPQQYR